MELLFMAAHAAESLVELSLARFRLTAPQYRVLLCLYNNGGLMIGDIADRLHQSRGNLTGIVDRLEAAEWVCRTRSREDRRAVWVSLNDAERFEQAKAAVDELWNSLPGDVQAYLARLVKTSVTVA